ncbi:MAG: excisionase [Lachnospiraceae bacterium]|nr:excisionase [Lachnospiraceae bacterium]
MNEKQQLPWWEKYALTLNEASLYFGIGYKKLKRFIQEHMEEEWILVNGNRLMIKRELFKKYLDERVNTI